MSDAATFNNSDSESGNGMHRNKKIILAVVVFIAVFSWLAWSLTHKKSETNQVTNNNRNSGVVVSTPTPEQIQSAKENIGTSGNIVSINTDAKKITLKITDTSQQTEFAYTDKTTIHKGISNETVTLADLKPNLVVSLPFEDTPDGKIAKDIWYQ